MKVKLTFSLSLTHAVFSVFELRRASKEQQGAERGSGGRGWGVGCPVWLIKAESCALHHPTVFSPPSASVYFNNVQHIVVPIDWTEKINILPLSTSRHTDTDTVSSGSFAIIWASQVFIFLSGNIIWTESKQVICEMMLMIITFSRVNLM